MFSPEQEQRGADSCCCPLRFTWSPLGWARVFTSGQRVASSTLMLLVLSFSATCSVLSSSSSVASCNGCVVGEKTAPPASLRLVLLRFSVGCYSRASRKREQSTRG